MSLGFIHRFLPSPEGRSPVTLLLLHGTGGDETDLLPLGAELSPGAALLSPRGKVLENGMPRFFRRLAEGVFDLEDLRFRAAELAQFVEGAAREYGFDRRQLFAAGFSNGANIAAAVSLLHPGTLAGAVLFSPMVPLIPDPRPDLNGYPVFIGAGRTDQIAPPAETERLAELLRQCGAAVELTWQPGGHTITRAELEAARLWLASQPPPGDSPK